MGPTVVGRLPFPSGPSDGYPLSFPILIPFYEVRGVSVSGTDPHVVVGGVPRPADQVLGFPVFRDPLVFDGADFVCTVGVCVCCVGGPCSTGTVCGNPNHITNHLRLRSSSSSGVQPISKFSTLGSVCSEPFKAPKYQSPGMVVIVWPRMHGPPRVCTWDPRLILKSIHACVPQACAVPACLVLPVSGVLGTHTERRRMTRKMPRYAHLAACGPEPAVTLPQ